MEARTRRLTLCAMMAALSTVLLMAGALPLATYCGPILAMLPLAAVAEEAGVGWAVGVYAVTAALGAMVVPEPEAVLVFACTGYYPALKKPLDRIRRSWLRRGAKLVLCLAALSLCHLYSGPPGGDPRHGGSPSGDGTSPLPAAGPAAQPSPSPVAANLEKAPGLSVKEYLARHIFLLLASVPIEA